MVKSLSYRIIFYLIFMVPNICLGSQDDSWWVMGSFRSPVVRDHVHSLDIFYQKEGENPSAVLKLDGSQWQAEIHNFNKKVVHQVQENLRCAKKSEHVYLALAHQELEHNLCVGSVKCFYGPKEYHNLPECWLSTNGANMEIHYRDKSRQEVRLYQPGNIKKIVDALNEGKGCVIALQKSKEESQQVSVEILLLKVADYASSSWIWWDGFKPISSKFDGWPNMAHFDIEKKTEYNVVNINVDEDKKYEAIYTKNQRIASLIKILSLASSCLVLSCLLHKMHEILWK